MGWPVKFLKINSAHNLSDQQSEDIQIQRLKLEIITFECFCCKKK